MIKSERNRRERKKRKRKNQTDRQIGRERKVQS